ncbi:sigma-70 family RNA polymerase sigma factor [Brevibacillus sp. SYP-B805]|uniref:RNA polymerase sigma factor n=1 Tax=Brevibacillus sp. SYP-B805 TaxID=1578199 RepID=UPI0013EADC92|nr:sigma-70 family RNA polymerase sigma factor [Brevibacillus sp. SYP-B805]NGQ96962.1 sigma-70 family RNA polymerase sigma factor [Brevibacillus sp. SYP-B805]
MDHNQTTEQRFSALYQQYYRDVYQFLFCFTGHKSDAEDLTQEVFLTVVKVLDTFEGRSHLKTWILGIAKNKARYWYRKKRLTTFFSDTLLQSLRTKEGLPEAELDSKEGVRELISALQGLKTQYRMVFILRCLKECSIKETSEILGCSEAKVKVDYHRACKMLQERLHPSRIGEWANGLAK